MDLDAWYSSGGGCSSLFHEFEEPVEEIATVVGSRGGLRMVLNREHRIFAVLDALDREIVQVEVREPQAGGPRNLVAFPAAHRETVVLRGDFTFWLSRFFTGWFPPWCPNGSLNVLAPKARHIS